MGDVSNTLKNYIPEAIACLAFILTQIISYQKLKWHVDSLLISINGIGAKVSRVEKAANEREIEAIMRWAAIQERIAKIEGILDSCFNSKVPNNKA